MVSGNLQSGFKTTVTTKINTGSQLTGPMSQNQSEINAKNKQIIKCTEFLVKVAKLLISLYEKDMNKKTEVKQNQDKIKKYLADYNQLVKDDSQKSLEMRIIEMEQMLKTNNFTTLEQTQKVINDQLQHAIRLNPYSETVQKLSTILIDSKSAQLKNSKTYPSPQFNSNVIPDQNMNNCFKSMTKNSCCDFIWNCLSQKRDVAFDIEKSKRQVDEAIELFEIKIKVQQKNKGVNNIETITTRGDCSTFSQQNSLINKSIEQPLIVLKPELAEVHTTGCKAHLLLSQNYFVLGEYSKAYSVLFKGIQFLQRVKIKKQTQEYERSLNISDMHVDLTIMRVRLENKRVEMYVGEMIKLLPIKNGQGESQQIEEIHSRIKTNQETVKETVNVLNLLQKQSQCSKIIDVSNYIKIYEQLASTYTLFNTVAKINKFPKSSSSNVQSLKNPIQQYKTISQLIKKQRGQYNMDLATIYCTVSRQIIRETVQQNKEKQKLQKGQKHLLQAFQVVSVFPFNNPNNFILFLLKFQIEYRKQLVEGNKGLFEFSLLEYAVRLIEQKFRDPTLTSISVILLYCQTLLAHGFYSQVKQKLEQLQKIFANFDQHFKIQQQNILNENIQNQRSISSFKRKQKPQTARTRALTSETVDINKLINEQSIEPEIKPEILQPEIGSQTQLGNQVKTQEEKLSSRNCSVSVGEQNFLQMWQDDKGNIREKVQIMWGKVNSFLEAKNAKKSAVRPTASFNQAAGVVSMSYSKKNKLSPLQQSIGKKSKHSNLKNTFKDLSFVSPSIPSLKPKKSQGQSINYNESSASLGVNGN